MRTESGFNVTEITASVVVIVAMLFLAVHLIPLVTAVLYAILPPVLLVWFITMVLRVIVRGLLP